MATKMTTGKEQCPLSKIKGKDGKYMRKIMVSGKCVNPTTVNLRRKGSEELRRQRSLQAKFDKENQ